MNFELSLSGVPQIDRAGEYPLLNADLDFIYQPPTHSIHLYDYDGVIKMNSEEIPFRSGDLTFEPTGNSYSIFSDNPGRHWCIHFFSPLQHGSPTFKLPIHLRLGGDSLFVLEQIKHISSLQNGRSETERLEAAYRFKSLLLSLYNMQSLEMKRVKRSNFEWQEFMELVDENLRSPISTPWLASRLNVSPVTLSKKFKKEYHCTIANYILRKRIDRAKSLLTTTRFTVSEVGVAVGIDDPQYFNKQFRKVTGVSPSFYRQENKPHLIDMKGDISIVGGRWREDE